MPFPMKVQPAGSAVVEAASRTPAKSRLKRLFERQFHSVMRISTAEKVVNDGKERDEFADVEPSSVCLDKMVMSFIEEGNNGDKPPRSRCNCFNGNNSDDRSDDEFADAPPLSVAPIGDSVDVIKGLVVCTSVVERNLLADSSKIIDKAKSYKGKDDRLRIVEDGLRALGHNASICKSKWDKAPSFPAGEYDYIDVIVDSSSGGRLIIDVDFKSEFEIAWSTKSYRAVLQQLPAVFVGTAERLQQIVSIVSEAARQSLKKKGLHVPPWRKPEYMKAKWLSPYQRTTAMVTAVAMEELVSSGLGSYKDDVLDNTIPTANFSGNVEKLGSCKEGENVVSNEAVTVPSSAVGVLWTSPPVRPKPGVKVVTGLASVL